MATTQTSPDLPKSSFAKVAASADKVHRTTSPRDTLPSSHQQRAGVSPEKLSDPVVVVGASVFPNQHARSQNTASQPRPQIVASATMDDASAGLKNLSLDSPVPNLVVCGSSPAALDKTRAASGSDESQRADSCSELDTKPPSLDGKSITSGTTFALDEKESLRPDDSASVQAAAEDDDTGSLQAGSEAAARGRTAQMELADRRQPAVVVGSQPPGILTPQSLSSEQPPPDGGPLPLRSDAGSSDALNVIYRSAPDEKLLDALATPRDRFFLLRLEKDVIDFVQNSKEPYMDLPPSNSFCRMLTHKLADYYHMTHSFEPHIGSVRIFRTPFCRVPPSLAQMVPQPPVSTSSTPPPAVLPRKIMRRGQEGDSGPVSASPSKPASEVGSDGKEKQPANQKLTREQREEMYKLARERIFGNSEENTAADNDTDNGMSRTSSMSANRSNLGKRGKPIKQRRDSDSFDSRHQYTPYWGPQQQTWVPQPQMQYMPAPAAPYGSPGQAAYPAPVPPGYDQQVPTYPAMPSMVPASPYVQYPAPQYIPQAPPQQYPGAGSPMQAYPTQMPSGTPPQSWQGSYSPSSPYAARGPVSQSHSRAGIPYAFGQLPANANPNDPKSQHPIPGSYNRNHAFNPKTQSFIPGGPMPPAHAPQPPFTAPGSHHSSPQIGTPHLVYSGYQSPMPPPYGGAYGMARQGSNTSLPPFHGPQQQPPPHPPHGAPMQGPPSHPPAPMNNRPQGQQGQGSQPYSHLPAYGNPASLPQKPATGI